MRNGPAAAVALAAFLAPLAASAQGERIRIRPRLWLTQESGKVRGDASPSTPGTDLNLDDDMGIDDDSALWVQLMLAQGMGRTWLNVWQTNAEGRTTLSSAETLDEGSFPAGTTVEGKLKIRYVNMIREQLLQQPFRLFGFPTLLSWLSGIEYVDILFELSGGGSAGDKGLQYFRPQIGLRAEMYLSRSFILDLHVFAFPDLEIDNVKARTLEWQVGLTIVLAKHITVDAGYRFTNITAEEDDGGEKAEADVDLEGYFFGLSLFF